VELNDDVIKEHLIIPGYFEPTPQFDKPMVGTHFGIPVDAIKQKWLNKKSGESEIGIRVR